MLDIEKIRGEFPILRREIHGRPLVYLDSGASAQKPVQVLDAMERMYRETYANVHRGVHTLSEQATVKYEAARETVRAFIGAADVSEIVFTSGATAAVNLVAYSFGEFKVSAGDNVVVSEMEHHSNIVPWQMMCERRGAQLRVLPFDDDGRMLTERLPELIDSRTRLVAVTQASNVLGTRPDLRQIIDAAHAAGAAVLVDGCQGVVHGAVDVQAMGCDFYVFSGHKLYGPTGIGALYARRPWLDELPPFMGGGDMVATVSFAGTTYAAPPLKFEAGTPNFVGAVGMAEAVRWLQQFDPAEVAAHEDFLTRAVTEKLLEIDGLRIYGTQSGKCPIVSFTVSGAHPYDIGMILDKMGVAVRTGRHCADPVMEHYGVTGMCRASLAVYNTVGEVETLAAGVKRAVEMLR
ncbi:MAG: SufS family cysteine desulfurase [Rikenellaceae bacterium]|nr:SufS family cysteine desulfurase [Rikenellaceae bacterium]MCL2692094.1 SufS family cysteine desulfurase [Rikenellaceae bacterium]